MLSLSDAIRSHIEFGSHSFVQASGPCEEESRFHANTRRASQGRADNLRKREAALRLSEVYDRVTLRHFDVRFNNLKTRLGQCPTCPIRAPVIPVDVVNIMA